MRKSKTSSKYLIEMLMGKNSNASEIVVILIIVVFLNDQHFCHRFISGAELKEVMAELDEHLSQEEVSYHHHEGEEEEEEEDDNNLIIIMRRRRMVMIIMGGGG